MRMDIQANTFPFGGPWTYSMASIDEIHALSWFCKVAPENWLSKGNYRS